MYDILEVGMFQGYLVKVGNYTIPYKYIKFDSYKVFMSITDLDSYRDGYGILQRNALEHKPNKCEFETPALLTNEEFATLMGNIQSNYTKASERKASVTLYIPEIDDYVTQDMYMPDIQPTIYRYVKATNQLQYNSIRLAFIGY